MRRSAPSDALRAGHAAGPPPRAPHPPRHGPAMGPGARHLGRPRRRRHRRLLRRQTAAHRPADDPQAATQHRGHERGGAAHRQPRRHGRRGDPHRRPAALPSQGLRRHRGPAVLLAFRHRPAGDRPRRAARRDRPRRHAGRLHPDPAARQEPVPDAGAHGLAQGAGGDPRAVAGAPLHQGADPRTLPQPRLLRLRRLRRGSGGAQIFRPRRQGRVARRGGDAGRADEGADEARAQPQPGRRRRSARRRWWRR